MTLSTAGVIYKRKYRNNINQDPCLYHKPSGCTYNLLTIKPTLKIQLRKHV